MAPADVITAVKDSGLRGRGGAGFPTGMKWGFMPQDDGKPHYLVVNADESEPGTCKDIPLMLADPHALIEGVIIASLRDPRQPAFIYVRGEVLHVGPPAAAARSQEAYAAGYLGKNILGTGFDLDVVVHAGAGAYICGEETALLDSLEGYRGQPRLRPPFPAVAGLYACPTVVNNVESIAACPSSCSTAPSGSRVMGTEKSTGFGAVLAVRPRHAARASTRRRWASRCASCSTWPAACARATAEVLDAGRLVTPLLTDEHLDVPLDFEGVGAAGSMLGTRRCRSSTRRPAWSARCCAGPSSTRTSRAASARPAARAPTGWCRSWSGWRRPGHRGGPRQAARHVRQHPRPLVLRAGRRRDQPDHVRRSSTSATSTSRTSTTAAARSTRWPPPCSRALESSA